MLAGPLKRCFSHMDSLLSPDFPDINFPISWMMFLVVCPNAPEVSMATGSNLYLLTRSGYFDRLAFSAFVAAWQGSIADSLMEFSPKVFTQVGSQQRALPWLKGNMVMPSGLFPSPRLRPTGSSTDGIPDDLMI